MMSSAPRMPVTKFGLHSSASRPADPALKRRKAIVGSDRRRMNARNGFISIWVVLAPLRSRVTVAPPTST